MKCANGVLGMLGASNFSPEMAVPMTVKIPEPMTAPMPSAVSDQGPRVFLSLCSGSSESRISLSMDLRASSWLGSAVLLGLSCGALRVPGLPGTPIDSVSGRLPLRDSARHLLDFLLVRSARLSPLGLGGGLLAGGSFQLLAFQPVFNLGGICHV
jgi:hypothetical protein